MTIPLNGPLARKLAAAVAEGTLVIVPLPKPVVIDVSGRRWGKPPRPALPMVRMMPPRPPGLAPAAADPVPRRDRVPLDVVEALEEVIAPDPARDPIPASLAAIVAEVCRVFKTTRHALEGQSRRAEDVVPRQAAMYLARRLTRLSRAQIGRRFGDRDHTTVLHACRATADRMAVDADFAARVGRIEAMFEGRP